MADAIARGARNLIIGLGGSATNDAGAGIDVVNVDDGFDTTADTGTVAATGTGSATDRLILTGLSGGAIDSVGLEALNVYLGT